jgi:hypothetical protein
MEFEGGCYCGNIRYRGHGKIGTKGMCFCRECQHISGGGGNVSFVIETASFTYTQEMPTSFARDDIDAPVLREFCGRCGTHIASRSPRVPGSVIIKAGTLDDPSIYGLPSVAVYTSERQPWHQIPDGVPSFERFPTAK